MTIVDIDLVARELNEQEPDCYPTAENVSKKLGVNARTVSRVVRDAGFSDFRAFTRQLFKL